MGLLSRQSPAPAKKRTAARGDRSSRELTEFFTTSLSAAGGRCRVPQDRSIARRRHNRPIAVEKSYRPMEDRHCLSDASNIHYLLEKLRFFGLGAKDSTRGRGLNHVGFIYSRDAPPTPIFSVIYCNKC
jgi:hypothetical protein